MSMAPVGTTNDRDPGPHLGCGSQKADPRVTSFSLRKKSGAYSGADERYRPFSFAMCRGVLTIDSTDASGRIASSVPARNPDQLLACSSDRKRWRWLHV
jgi:hypothetical protein